MSSAPLDIIFSPVNAAAPDTAEPRRFAALEEAELDALIERVREARDHDLALDASDLSLLLDALMTLASVHERLEHDDLTIAKLQDSSSVWCAVSFRRARVTARPGYASDVAVSFSICAAARGQFHGSQRSGSRRTAFA